MPEDLVPLTSRQAKVFDEIARLFLTRGKGASLGYLAHHLNVKRDAPRCHVNALWRKGWLASPSTPATPHDRWLSCSTYRSAYLTR